jgi:ribose transport system ATP-binding protein
MTTGRTAVAFEGVTKRFGATTALDGATLRIPEGSVHALLGENGAGKSTTVKILSGLIQPDEGAISVFGERVVIGSPRAAQALGIQTAFQELPLVPDLTVAQSLLLTHEPRRFWFVRRRALHREAGAHLEALGLENIDPRAEIRQLDVPTRQKIEIAKALVRKPKVLLLDEPTSALSGRDVDWLGDIVARLKRAGVTVVFISHRMPEVRQFCDSLSVLRNGKDVGSFSIAAVSDDQVIELVAGRAIGAVFPARSGRNVDRVGTPFLSVRDLATDGRLTNASFDLHGGEILGIAGLQGMGQLDLFHALFGLEPVSRGEIRIDGQRVLFAAPSDAVNANVGISLVPEDRKSEALFLQLSGKVNVSLPVIERFTRFGVIDTRAEAEAVDAVLARVNVHPRALYKPCASFSGGNQQKIAIAKWLLAGSRVLLLFDPTRGVDVGTKHEIYELMIEFVRAGGAILFYSTETPELVNLCDRVLVMYRGAIVDDIAAADLTEERVVRGALGEGAGQEALRPPREAVS